MTQKRRVPKIEEYMPTQEELLEEVEITEKENLRSLEKFQKLELEKKKTRPTKRIFTGPTIIYHSMSMPIVEDISPPVNTENSLKCEMPRPTRCERTFVSFENDIDNKTFSNIFPMPNKRERRSKICAITRLPARYYDPITQLPYRNMQAFKIIREAYYQQLEEKGNTDNPNVTKWLQWRKQVKEMRSRAAAK